MSRPESKPLNLASAGVVGSEVLGFALVGLLIDYALGTLYSVPWATLILGPLGLIVAMLHLMKLVKPGPQP